VLKLLKPKRASWLYYNNSRCAQKDLGLCICIFTYIFERHRSIVRSLVPRKKSCVSLPRVVVSSTKLPSMRKRSGTEKSDKNDGTKRNRKDNSDNEQPADPLLIPLAKPANAANDGPQELVYYGAGLDFSPLVCATLKDITTFHYVDIRPKSIDLQRDYINNLALISCTRFLEIIHFVMSSCLGWRLVKDELTLIQYESQHTNQILKYHISTKAEDKRNLFNSVSAIWMRGFRPDFVTTVSLRARQARKRLRIYNATTGLDLRPNEYHSICDDDYEHPLDWLILQRFNPLYDPPNTKWNSNAFSADNWKRK
jgi:hypothetical protein